VLHRVVIAKDHHADIAREYRVPTSTVAAIVNQARHYPEQFREALDSASKWSLLEAKLIAFVRMLVNTSTSIESVNHLRSMFET
jgi:transposase